MNKITAANPYWHGFVPVICILALFLLAAGLGGCGPVPVMAQVVQQTQIVPVTQIIPVTQIVEMTQTAQPTRRPTSSGPTAAAVSQVSPSTAYVTVSAQQDWQDSGFHLEAGSYGSVAYVTGAWTVDFSRGLHYVGPEGYPEAVSLEAGCEASPLAEAPAGALLAQVGDGPAFTVGSQAGFEAAPGGDVYFRINDGCLDQNDGKIVVRVDRLEAPLPAPAPVDPAAREFTVAADQVAWQDSGIALEKGQEGTIAYLRGVWSFNLRGASQYFVGPAGYPYNYTSVLAGKCGSRPLPGAPFGALLARAGGGTPFVVGTSAVFKAERQGELTFRINDDCMGDDWGQIMVQITLAK